MKTFAQSLAEEFNSPEKIADSLDFWMGVVAGYLDAQKPVPWSVLDAFSKICALAKKYEDSDFNNFEKDNKL